MFNETNWMGGIETFKVKVKSPGGNWRLANTIKHGTLGTFTILFYFLNF